MSRLRQLHHALTRARGHRKGRRSGVAILMVVATLMIMTVVVTELAYGSRVRLLTASHASHRVQSYWLARSGVNLYSLLLMVNKQLGKQYGDMAESMGLSGLGDSIWQMVPMINTGLLRMLMGDGDVEEDDMAEFARTGRVSEEVAAESREAGLFSDKNFLDFDGDFTAEVTDHESRININAFATDTAQSAVESPIAQQVYFLMSGEENDQWFRDRNMDRWEIIGNLKDWVDKDTLRSGGLGGYEDNLYNTLDPPYLTKNAPFETVEEIHVVAGCEGEVYDRFGEHLTVFGNKDGKVNILTAPPEVKNSLVRAAANPKPTDDQLGQCEANIEDTYLGFPVSGVEDFISRYQQTCGIMLDKQTLNKLVTDSSSTFTVTSTGLVGTSSVTITAVLSFESSSRGKMLYWRVD
jgi:type II secretory pathway component PulK